MQISKIKLFSIKQYRFQMGMLMFFADIVGFASAGMALYYSNTFFGFLRDFNYEEYLVFVLLCMILFMYSRLYPGNGVNPADEIRLVVQRTGIGFVVGFIILLFVQAEWRPNLWALVITWGAAPAAILLARWSVRILASRLEFWGEPVVVIANRDRIANLVRYFLQRRRLGFVPVLAVVPDLGVDSLDLPVPAITLGELLTAGTSKLKGNPQTALVEIERTSEIIRSDSGRVFSGLFRQVVLFFDVDWLEGASLRIQDFEGLLGVEARKNVLSPLSKAVKRGMDLLIGTLLGVASLPVFFAAALAVRLDAPGSIFYVQERVGRKGDRIKIYKFRTMVKNADQVLADTLQKNPAARQEWEQSQKLKDDPRITRPGKWLRKFSVDELPQLINVFKGEMSLVGPRPIVATEAHHYSNNYEMYTSVRPGLTGLWQVSGRNHTSYPERVRYDAYYVRNWSVWLDIYILLRTVWVVLSRDGAY